MVIQKPAEQQQDETSDEWQLCFSKQFHILFNRIRRIRNYKVQADFFKALMPAQQKSRRVMITLQYKIDREIEKLLSQWHIKNLKGVWIKTLYRQSLL